MFNVVIVINVDCYWVHIFQVRIVFVFMVSSSICSGLKYNLADFTAFLKGRVVDRVPVDDLHFETDRVQN